MSLPAVEAASRDAFVTLEDIEEAALAIAPHVRRTPLVRSASLSDRLGTNVYLKLELFQKTGAFKVRGAFNRMLGLTRSERARGVVAVSGGNHAQAVAYAARALGTRARILMPEATPPNYVEATRGYGAEVAFHASLDDAFAEAARLERAGFVFIHPFDDPLVIAGQGTIGLEIVEDLPEVTDVIVSIGGGGMAGGVGAALKLRHPDSRLWGVETEGAASMTRSLAAGRVERLRRVDTIARTLAVAAVSERTLRLAQRFVDDVVVVSDADTIRDLWEILERAKVLTEPAASCTLSAAWKLRRRFAPGGHVVLVLCGGNAPLPEIRSLRTGPATMPSQEIGGRPQ